MKIKAEFIIGTSIYTAFEKATSFATKNNVTIEFDFNGVKCLAFPNGKSYAGVNAFHEAIEKETNLATNTCR